MKPGHPSFWRWAALLGFAGATCISAYTFWREFSVVLQPPASSQDYGAELISGPAGFAFSSNSKKAAVERCFSVLGNRFNYTIEQEGLDRIAENCATTGERISASMPSMGAARLMEGYAAFLLNDEDRANDLLTQSFLLTPSEGWLAVARLWLVENYRDQLSAENRKREDGDIALLAASYEGAKVLAARYMADDNFRERAVGVIETLSPAEQKRFLDLVKNKARKGE